jgi:PST family polysaccharide transporter
VTAFNIINYFHRNLDNLLIGKVWGAEALGLYSRAYAILMFPIETVRNPLNAVAFPAMCKLQARPADFRAYYRRLALMVAFFSMPLSSFLFVAASPVIELLLGPKWDKVTSIYATLAIVAFIQPVQTLWGVVVLSSGMAKRYLFLGILNTAFCVVGFIAGLPWGPMGVSTGYAVATIGSTIPILGWAFRGTPVRLKDFFQCVTRPGIAAVTAGIVCIIAERFVAILGNFSPMTLLLSLGVVFLASYLSILYFMPGGCTDLGFIWNVASPLVPRWFRPQCFFPKARENLAANDD